MVAGGNYKLFVRQPSSGGPDTLALGTGCTWINNPLRWSTTANSVDLLVWWYDGTSCWAVQGTINGPVSYGTPAASAATNFGSAIGSTNLVASVPATGVYNVGGSAYVSTAGAGCSSATNSATVTWAWTDATGTSQTADRAGCLRFWKQRAGSDDRQWSPGYCGGSRHGNLLFGSKHARIDGLQHNPEVHGAAQDVQLEANVSRP